LVLRWPDDNQGRWRGDRWPHDDDRADRAARLRSPLHVHHNEDEWFYLLEGELTIWVADQTVAAPAGSFVFGPRDVPHTFIVSSDEARFLLVTQAAGFEGFIRTLGTPAPVAEIPPAPAAPPDMAPVLQGAADHGLEILGPPGIPA
jgi:mannose-6-phosphate isomerase-like protein (cupin superfamily)